MNNAYMEDFAINAEAATKQQVETTEEVFAQLCRDDSKVYPKNAIRKIREQSERFIPELLACLERAVVHVENDEPDQAHDEPALIAFCLLIEFDVKEAWPITQRLIRLPGEGPFEVLGDGIHEILPTAVALWAQDDLEGLVEFCLDTSANEYCRSSLSRGVCDGYARGLVPRESMLEFHRILISQAAADDYEFRSFVISNLMSVHADELRGPILDAFRNDLVETFIIGASDVEDQFQCDKEREIRKYQDRLEPLDNFTDQLASWAGFQPKPEPSENSTKPIRPMPLPPIEAPQHVTARLDAPRIGRNDLCPCGSGKKYKKCCL